VNKLERKFWEWKWDKISKAQQAYIDDLYQAAIETWRRGCYFPEEYKYLELKPKKKTRKTLHEWKIKLANRLIQKLKKIK
jgi:hypothetical protein